MTEKCPRCGRDLIKPFPIAQHFICLPCQRVSYQGQTYPIIDKRQEGYHCVYCNKFSKDPMMDETGMPSDLNDGSTIIFVYDKTSIAPKVKEFWRVFQHYDGCRGWS